MTLFIANGSEVQLPAWQWREVADQVQRIRSQNRVLANTINAAVAGKHGMEQVRIPLRRDDIDAVRGVVERD